MENLPTTIKEMNVDTVSTEVVDITWAIGHNTEDKIRNYVTTWLREHEKERTDTALVTRVLMERLNGNLNHANFYSYPTAVSYNTVWRTVWREQSLSDNDSRAKLLQNTLDIVWAEMVVRFRDEDFSTTPR